LKGQTKICKICLKPIHNWSFHIFFKNNYCVCEKCEEKLRPLFLKFRVGNIDALAIYEYDEEIRTLLYQLKGCYDIELAEVFLDRFKDEMHFLFHDYFLIPAPSSKANDEEREFNHVKVIFQCLNLPMLPIIEKAFDYKQAELSAKERKVATKSLKLNDMHNLYGKKILIVDDVYTTGATVRGMIGLIKTLKPKKIKILVMSKTYLK